MWESYEGPLGELHGSTGWGRIWYFKINLECILISKLRFITHIGLFVALAFSSGVAGISAVVQTFKQNDHIVYVQCSNGDSDYLFRNKWKDFGMEVDFIYNSECESILQAIKPNTKVKIFELGEIYIFWHKYFKIFSILY